MTAPKQRLARGVPVPPASRQQTPAQAGLAPASPRPERARTWRIELPAGMELLTSNQQGGAWQKQYRITKPIKDAAIVLARAAKIPHLDRVDIVVEFRPPTGRRRVVREAHNLGPSAKAAIDGLVKAGVLTDDSDRYVANVSFREGEPHQLGQLALIVTELPKETSHA